MDITLKNQHVQVPREQQVNNWKFTLAVRAGKPCQPAPVGPVERAGGGWTAFTHIPPLPHSQSVWLEGRGGKKQRSEHRGWILVFFQYFTEIVLN